MGGSSIQSSTVDSVRVVLVIFPFSKITLANQQSAVLFALVEPSAVALPATTANSIVAN